MAKKKSKTRKPTPRKTSPKAKRKVVKVKLAARRAKHSKTRAAAKTVKKAVAKSKMSKNKQSKPSKKATPTRATTVAKAPAATKPLIQARPISRPSLVRGPAISIRRTKILPREFLFDVAKAVRDSVEPLVRAAKGREVVGSATSGDATFQLDKIAEKALLTFLREAKMPVAYYSEDAGYATFTTGQPQHLLVVDPIDGSRAAKSGLEGCVVSVASTRVIERPRIADIDNGCVMEIIGNRTFFAERGKGARIYADDTIKKPKLSKNTNLETVTWSMTVPARPAELIFPTAAKLIDLTSLKGGFFSCNSTSYSLTRLLTCQYDACVDFANRYLRDIPDVVEDHFINAGRGIVLGIAPYDIAASILIAREAGCVVTDAYGSSFDDVLLLDSSVGNHRSLIAAANAELHEKLFSFFDTRIRQFELLLSRRAQPANSN